MKIANLRKRLRGETSSLQNQDGEGRKRAKENNKKKRETISQMKMRLRDLPKLQPQTKTAKSGGADSGFPKKNTDKNVAPSDSGERPPVPPSEDGNSQTRNRRLLKRGTKIRINYRTLSKFGNAHGLVPVRETRVKVRKDASALQRNANSSKQETPVSTSNPDDLSASDMQTKTKPKENIKRRGETDTEDEKPECKVRKSERKKSALDGGIYGFTEEEIKKNFAKSAILRKLVSKKMKKLDQTISCAKKRKGGETLKLQNQDGEGRKREKENMKKRETISEMKMRLRDLRKPQPQTKAVVDSGFQEKNNDKNLSASDSDERPPAQRSKPSEDGRMQSRNRLPLTRRTINYRTLSKIGNVQGLISFHKTRAKVREDAALQRNTNSSMQETPVSVSNPDDLSSSDMQTKSKPKGNIKRRKATDTDKEESKCKVRKSKRIKFALDGGISGFTEQEIKKNFAKSAKLRKLVSNELENLDETTNGDGAQMKRSKRKATRKKFRETDGSDDDDYLFCHRCKIWKKGDCLEHGPFFPLKDTEVPNNGTVPMRADKTIPSQFEIRPSSIPKAGRGIYTKYPLPAGIRLGPYEGVIRKKVDDESYCWEIVRRRKPLHVIDGSDLTRSNWLRYVNCARHKEEQNLYAYQYQGKIYYRTYRFVPSEVELLVWYGDISARSLGIDPLDFEKDVCKKISTDKGYLYPCDYCYCTFTAFEYLQKHLNWHKIYRFKIQGKVGNRKIQKEDKKEE